MAAVEAEEPERALAIYRKLFERMATRCGDEAPNAAA